MSGRLIYVVGASGVGKDSVLARLRTRAADDDRIVIAHRYITRPADAGGENHVALLTEEFQLRLAAGCFALHWQSHGLSYGIGCEIDGWLATGLTVLVNGSRAHWPQTLRRYPNAQLVEITASAATIATRLASRGRESNEAIQARLLRNATLSDQRLAAHQRIANDGPLDWAVENLLGWLRSANHTGLALIPVHSTPPV